MSIERLEISTLVLISTLGTRQECNNVIILYMTFHILWCAGLVDLIYLFPSAGAFANCCLLAGGGG